MKRARTSSRRIGGHKPNKYKLKYESINLNNQKECTIFKNLTYFSVGCLVASSLANEMIGFIASGLLTIIFLALYYDYTHESGFYFEEVQNSEDKR